MLRLETNMGTLALEDHHLALVLESVYHSGSGTRDETVRHTLDVQRAERLHAALGTWLERQRPARR